MSKWSGLHSEEASSRGFFSIMLVLANSAHMRRNISVSHSEPESLDR